MVDMFLFNVCMSLNESTKNLFYFSFQLKLFTIPILTCVDKKIVVKVIFFYRKFDLAAPWEQFPNFREQLPAAEEVDIDKK